MQAVIKVTPDQLDKMASTYPANRKLPNGAIFASKITGATITGYKSGKVLFQGPLAEKEADRWGTIVTSNSPSKSAPDLPPNFDHLAVLGSDEVGTGAYFGPLTTAAVFVPADQVDALIKRGVKDSKKLTDPKILELAKAIEESCPYHVLDLAPHDYNRLINQYNQAQLKALCHNFVLLKVLDKIAPTKPDAILIDQFVQARTYFNYLKGQARILRERVYFKEKGESYHVAVAAASIVARAYSLATMNQLSDEAGMTLPIGAGSKVDQVAIKLAKAGKDLDHFAKLHFGNTNKVKQALKKAN
ncbi:ribonuclease HIII [Lactobacillus sp. 3B(2020)]|uniref:ribonuclease HIII n=1 Tax=Lactobacillus sp. 3B(2020) TaxID=2695882 RepID=UPI0015E05404|nr:ribonuclease HIII [Lactobacillus sp. 3B(2020)]QLL69498.1 ribonuclease HIII [Lactobacillus sp. 3B(2020)]